MGKAEMENDAKAIVQHAFESANKQIQEVMKATYDYGVLATFAQLFVDGEITEQQFSVFVDRYTVSTAHEWKLGFENGRNHIAALKELQELTKELMNSNIALDYFTMRLGEIKDL